MGFYCSKEAIKIHNMDAKKILVFDKFTFDENKDKNARYFIR